MQFIWGFVKTVLLPLAKEVIKYKQHFIFLPLFSIYIHILIQQTCYPNTENIGHSLVSNPTGCTVSTFMVKVKKNDSITYKQFSSEHDYNERNDIIESL